MLFSDVCLDSFVYKIDEEPLLQTHLEVALASLKVFIQDNISFEVSDLREPLVLLFEFFQFKARCFRKLTIHSP